MRLSRREKAEEMYQLVLRLNPNHTVALHNLGQSRNFFVWSLDLIFCITGYLWKHDIIKLFDHFNEHYRSSVPISHSYLKLFKFLYMYVPTQRE